MSHSPHLMLDCKSTYRLNDIEYITDFLSMLPGEIGLDRITLPHVFRYRAPEMADSGLTGVVLTPGSHICIRTYPAKNYFFVDIFSCDPYDMKKVQQMVMNWFRATSCKRYAAARGSDFPRD